MSFHHEHIRVRFIVVLFLSGLSFIELYSDFGEALLSSPDSRDSKDELSRILLQSASNESAEMSKYSSSSATALADEFETFRMTLILGSGPLGRGVDDLSDASVPSSLSDEMSISSYISSRWVIFFKKFFLPLQLTFIFDCSSMNSGLIRIKENIGINPSILIGYSIILILFNPQVLTLFRRRFYWLQIKLIRLAKIVNVMLTSFSLA